MTTVLDRDGVAGTLDGAPGTDGAFPVRLASGRLLRLAPDLVWREADGTFRAVVAFADADRERLLEVEEQLLVGRREVETGRVRATVRTVETEQTVDEPGWRETVLVEREPVGTVVDAAEPVRREGDVTIVPVYEEVVVVEKRLVLVERLRLTLRREETRAPERVVLRQQHVEVERLPALDPASGRPESPRT